MKKIYFISGLGADERVFKFLQISGIESSFIHWETPLNKEPLKDYCQRLIKQIDPTDEIILIGVSFGGIVAQEISKMIPVHKIVIISSIQSRKDLDRQLKLVRWLRLYYFVPSRFLKWSNLLTADYYFGTKTKEESELLKLIIHDTDRCFMKWAISEIMHWDNAIIPRKSVIHIHGTKDRIFPVKNIKNVIKINNGGHFMIVNRAKEISEIIESQLI